MMKATLPWILGIFVLLGFGCTKKEDEESVTAETERTTESQAADNAPTSIAEPVGVLNIALEAMQSIMKTDLSDQMVGAGLRLGDDSGFTVDDCSAHAETLARSTDAAEFIDSDGRLKTTHPRYALQSLFCQMSKDTGAPDSFLGALSENKMFICFLGSSLTFDGEAKEITVTKAMATTCTSHLSAAKQEEMLENFPDELILSVTASRPAAFGNAIDWDGSIEVKAPAGDPKLFNKLLLRDSDGVLAMAATNNGNGRALSVDAYLVSITKETGVLRFESKAQRIRTASGSTDDGWNQHAVVRMEGTLNDDLTFSEVTSGQGLYGTISANKGDTGATSASDPLQQGYLWTAVGSSSGGFKTFSYNLDCSVSGNTTTCPDVNAVASWPEIDGTAACNGGTGGTCTNTGLEFTTNAQTSFVMDADNAAFQKVEDWFTTLALPTTSELTLSINQE